MRHSSEFWQNVIHWRREWQTTPVYLLWEPHKLFKRTKRYDTKDETLRSEGVQYATGEEQRTTNRPKKNEAAVPKQKWHSIVDGSGDEAKIQCCKEQYCIGTWNVSSMSQGKLDVIKREIVRINLNILGISEIKWTRMGEFNWDDLYIYYCGQESHRNNWVTLIINKSQKCTTWGNLKNDRMVSVHF